MHPQLHLPPPYAAGSGAPVLISLGPRLPVFEVGQEIQLFRLGPLHDRTTGEHICDITDEMCAEMARVFALQNAEGVPVPIDWNHGTEDPDAAPHQAVTFGRIVSMRHEPGAGLWGEPAYNAAGIEMVKACGGALFTSPAFVLAGRFNTAAIPANVGAYSKNTGERIGDCQIKSVALTPQPFQNGLGAVLLSESSKSPPRGAAQPKEERMAENTAPVTPPAPAVALAEPPPAPAAETTQKLAETPEEMAAMIESLKAEIAALKAQNESLMAAQAVEMSDDKKALAETRRNLTLLSERVAKAEAAASAEKLARELDQYEAQGLFAPARRAHFAEMAQTSRKLFSDAITHLRAHPEVPMGQVGHSAKVETPPSATAEFQGRVSLLLSEGKAATRVDAINAVKAADPALYARAIRE